jgi:hypothetical protein
MRTPASASSPWTSTEPDGLSGVRSVTEFEKVLKKMALPPACSALPITQISLSVASNPSQIGQYRTMLPSTSTSKPSISGLVSTSPVAMTTRGAETLALSSRHAEKISLFDDHLRFGREDRHPVALRLCT